MSKGFFFYLIYYGIASLCEYFFHIDKQLSISTCCLFLLCELIYNKR